MGRLLVAAFLFASTTSGCASEPAGTDNGPPADTDGVTFPSADVGAGAPGVDVGSPGPNVVTYHGDIRPLIAANCESCHIAGGGGPFPLNYSPTEWEDGAAWWAPSVVEAVSEGSMPPWLPDPSCRPIKHDRVLSPEEVSAFETWQADAFPVGDPGDYQRPPAPEEVELGEPDISLDAGEAYMANPLTPDDYRCFLVGDALEDNLYIRAVAVTPGDTSIVHHVLLYAIAPDNISDVEDRDAASDGLGYKCFGGPGASNPATIAAWAPGGVPFVTPEGSAMRVEAGSRFVMQVHYNMAYLGADAEVPPDLSVVQLWTFDSGESPDALVRVLPYAHLGLEIEAGNPTVVEQTEFDIPFTATLIGVVPHMHVLGTAIRSELLTEDETTTCLVDIPAWDFNWQQFYLFDEEHHLPLIGGDTHRLTCEYDNSLENQPVVNGEQLPPQTVTWGDGTFDEMCLSYLVVMTPFDADGGVCTGVDTCAAECEAGAFDCFFGCALVPGSACIQCLGIPFVECGGVECPAEAAEAVACFQGECGDDVLTCVTDTCATQFDILHGCLHEPMLQGACNDHFAACELSY